MKPNFLHMKCWTYSTFAQFYCVALIFFQNANVHNVYETMFVLVTTFMVNDIRCIWLLSNVKAPTNFCNTMGYRPFPNHSEPKHRIQRLHRYTIHTWKLLWIRSILKTINAIVQYIAKQQRRMNWLTCHQSRWQILIWLY